MMVGINKSIGKILRRYGRKNDGVAAIEFALVGGPFLFVLFAIFELGLMLFAEYALAQNVESAGRLIRTGQVQNGLNGHSATPAYFKTQVCKNLETFLDCSSNLYVDVRKFNDFSSISGSLPDPYDSGTTELSEDITLNSEYQPGAAGEIVSIRVYYDWQLFMPGLSALVGAVGSFGNVSASGSTETNSRLLTAAATFRNEPFN